MRAHGKGAFLVEMYVVPALVAQNAAYIQLSEPENTSSTDIEFIDVCTYLQLTDVFATNTHHDYEGRIADRSAHCIHQHALGHKHAAM